MSANIWKTYWITMMNESLFFMPIIVLFFSANGLSNARVFYLLSIYSLVIVALEIPSGYLSDCWGRKNTLVAGSLCGVIGIAIYAISSGFWGFLVANLFLAVLASFSSGTVEALIYDTLIELGDTDHYRKITGRQYFWGSLTRGVVSVSGGYLAAISLRTPVYVTVIPFVLGFLITVTLREPRRKKRQEMRHLKTILNVATDTLIRNVPLRSIVALYSVLGGLILLLGWISQLYQEMVELPISLFGWVSAVAMLGGALASLAMHRIEKWVNDRLVLILISALIVGCYVLLGVVSSLWGIVFLVLGRSAFGAFNVLVGDLVNKITTSDVRATVLSIQSFAFRIVFSILSPLVGYMTGVLSLNQTLFYIGICSAVVVGAILLLTRRVI